ncbi:MAG: DUF1592 domain-containing protein [Lentisphaeraceae bacterium]|nr:DUF1592 domain-containing protein [Lentisphaeraceae bacterium]
MKTFLISLFILSISLLATPDLPLKFIEEHCQKCHNADKHKGGVDFTKYKTAKDFWKDSKVWKTSIELVQTGEMPTKKELSDDQINHFSEAITKVLEAEDFSVKDWFGRSILRRLSPIEIEHSLSDIARVKMNIAKNFPIDSGGGEGFSNNADTMRLTPIFFDKLSIAAESFAAHAEFDPFHGIVFNQNPKPALNNEQYLRSQKMNRDDFYTVRSAKMIRHEIKDKGILDKYIDAAGDLMLSQRRTDLRAIKLKAIEKDLVPGVIWMWTQFLGNIEKEIKRKNKMRYWTVRTFSPFTKALKDNINDPEKINQIIELTKKKLAFLEVTRKSIYAKNFKRQVLIKGSNPLRINIGPANDGHEFDYVNMHDAFFTLKNGKKVYLKDLEPMNINGQVHIGLNGAGQPAKPLADGTRDKTIGFKAPAQVFFSIPTGAKKFSFGLKMDTKSEGKGYIQALVDQKTNRELLSDIVDEGFLFMGPGPMAGKTRGQVESLKLYMQYRFYPTKEYVKLTLSDKDQLEEVNLQKNYSWAWELSNYTDSAFLRKNKLKKLPTSVNIKSFNKKIQKRYDDHIKNSENFKNLLHKQVSSAISDFSLKLYRKPLQDIELKEWMQLFKNEYQKSGKLQETIQSLIVSMVLTPSFIYKFEDEQKGKIDSYDLATRLSYFLWSSTPDKKLLDLAAKKQLSQESILAQQIDRMLKDPKAERLSNQFFMSWLHTDKIKKDKIPNHKVFPEYNEELRDLMLKEVKLFTNDLINNDHNINSLIAANHSFLNEDLAKFYGVEGVTGKAFQRVELASHNRGGILGMGAVHVATSYPERTSPVLRGQWILETLIGSPVPPPPVDVEIPEAVLMDKNLTVKEKLAKHREVSSCAICHDRIDPLGFSMENFDGIGRWRTQENNLPIDVEGELKDGSKLPGIQGLKHHLTTKGQEAFIEHFTGKLLGFALGRGLDYPDRAIVRHATNRAKVHNYKFSELVKGLIISPAFLTR